MYQSIIKSFKIADFFQIPLPSKRVHIHSLSKTNIEPEMLKIYGNLFFAEDHQSPTPMYIFCTYVKMLTILDGHYLFDNHLLK